MALPTNKVAYNVVISSTFKGSCSFMPFILSRMDFCTYPFSWAAVKVDFLPSSFIVYGLCAKAATTSSKQKSVESNLFIVVEFISFRKYREKYLHIHFHPINFKHTNISQLPDFIAIKEFHAADTFVKVVAEGDAAVPRLDFARTGPKFEVYWVGRLEHAFEGGDVN